MMKWRFFNFEGRLFFLNLKYTREVKHYKDIYNMSTHVSSAAKFKIY